MQLCVCRIVLGGIDVHNMDYLLIPWVGIVEIIAHGHGDVNFAHYALHLYPADLNHTIRLFERFLCDLEKLPSYSSILLYENTGSTPLYEVVLDRKDVCLHSLLEPPSEPLIAMELSPTMCVQLENCAKDNKNRYVFAYRLLLVV
jgi:hypothetical protein